jgi:hypothetical protein
MAASATGRSVIVLPIDPGLTCLRGLSPQRLRFEVEYGLERGTSANSFLFAAGSTGAGQPVPPVLVHPHPSAESQHRQCSRRLRLRRRRRPRARRARRR